jgi:cytochrome oxidase Cu insertion factor (SCO1/SenC/PrrC family)
MIPHVRRRHLSPMQRYIALGFVSLVLGTGYAIVLWRTQPTAASSGDSSGDTATDSDTAFNAVDPFTLVDSAGRTVTRETLLGKPWIAGFVFTRCTGPCPLVTSNMRKAQDMLAQDDVRLVTISVDPEFDTPEVLATYAKGVGADMQRWLFLTGTPEAVRELSRTSFMLPIEKEAGRPVGESIVHRTNLTVVDARGVVRGYYDGEKLEGVEQAVARARFLAHEPVANGPR